MALPSMKLETSKTIEEAPVGFTVMQRYMLRRFHPRSLMVEIVSSIWAVYFFGQHQWLAALIAIAVGRLIGNLLGSQMDYQEMSSTVWGKIALLHLHPMNYSIQFVGAIVAFYGIWVNATLPILSGLSIIFLGHLWGWQKVSRSF